MSSKIISDGDFAYGGSCAGLTTRRVFLLVLQIVFQEGLEFNAFIINVSIHVQKLMGRQETVLDVRLAANLWPFNAPKIEPMFLMINLPDQLHLGS